MKESRLSGVHYVTVSRALAQASAALQPRNVGM